MNDNPSWQLAGRDYPGPARTIIAATGTGKTEAVITPAAHELKGGRGENLVILDPPDDDPNQEDSEQ